MNATLERVEGEIKARFATGVIGDIDKAVGPLDDVVANWSVARARDNAWVTARTTCALRDKPKPAPRAAGRGPRARVRPSVEAPGANLRRRSIPMSH